MNTLGYVARQFDVLASSNPLPTSSSSIATAHRRRRSERSSDPNSPDIPLQRVSTWSFLFPPTASHSSSIPRRTRSSPSFVSIPNQPPPIVQPATDPLPTRSKSHIDSVINQIFFIRVFLVVWDNIKAVWSSLTHHVTIFTIEHPPLPSEKDIVQTLPPSTAQATEQYIHLHTAEPESTISSPLTDPSPSVQSSSLPKSSRSSTPILNAKKTPFHLPKTLVLDLDETLIHSTSRPMFSQASNGSGLLSLGSFGRSNKGAGHIVEVALGGRSTLYHVYKRPFVDFFLRTVRP
jgi:CTD nuclear envelope phosphatase 1